MSGRTQSEPPPAGRIRPFNPPVVENVELKAGLPLKVARMPRLPVVSLRLLIDSSEAGLPEEEAGLAALTGKALEAGAGGRGSAELAEALESIGASVGVSTGWDSTTVSLSCLADRMEEAFELLADMVMEPTFPSDEVERLRGQRLAQLEQSMADPGALAGHSALRFLYADGEPYGRRLLGERASIAGFDRDALSAFHARAFGPAGAAIVATGDVDTDALAKRIDARFAGWSGGGGLRPSLSCEPRSREARVWVVHREGAVQSEIRLGHVGTHRKTEDFFSLRVFNEILGGLFSSRLNQNLREKHGFTYGVRSRFELRRSPGPFLISTAVETAVTGAAVREALSEVAKMLAEGPTVDEVESARDYMAGVFPLQFETSRQMATQVGRLHVYDLPDDLYDTYRDQIRAVTRESAHEAGRRQIRPQEIQVVVVGDAGVIRADLEALGVGELSVVDPS